jgi:ABC-type branched-subunit amino acid transport system ATPase component
MNDTLLSAHDLTVRFGGVLAVNRVSFEVKQGEVFTLIGPNGAGKTTVFNLISRIYTPTTGHLSFLGQRLSDVPQLGRDIVRAQVYVEQALQPRFPDVHLADLQQAWRDIVKRAKLVQHHVISREQLSVREHMSIVLRTLQGRRFVEFENLFDTSRGMPVLVVTFIALLELAKEGLVDVTQAEAFAPIYVRLAYTPA